MNQPLATLNAKDGGRKLWKEILWRRVQTTEIHMQTHRFQKNVLVAVVVLLSVFLCSGHSQPTDKPEAVFTGQLTDLDIDRLTMTVQALPLAKIFGIAPDCEVITKAKPQASLEDLR